MDVPKFAAIPVPVTIATVRTYPKAVKEAKLSAQFTMATVSTKAKDLLADCCAEAHLATPVPAFLEIHAAKEDPSYLLLKPTMTASDATIPVTVQKRRVAVNLAKLLTLLGLQTVRGTRLVIPVSTVTIAGWGPALVLHMGALQWRPVTARKGPHGGH